jgi:phage portal protein BeeE
MGKKPGYYQANDAISESTQKELIEEINKVEASSEAPLLSQGIAYTSIGQSNRDMQLSELKKQVDEEIQKVFHIKNDFYDTFREAIYPIIKLFEKTINLELLAPEEIKYLYFKFDTRETTSSANVEDRYKAYINGQKAGLLTINEIRKFEGLEELKELDTINFGLNSVLYNVKKGTYFIPNTSITMKPQEGKNSIKEETISENIVNEKEYSRKEKEEIGNNKNKK